MERKNYIWEVFVRLSRHALEIGDRAEGLEGAKAGVTEDGLTCNQHG